MYSRAREGILQLLLAAWSELFDGDQDRISLAVSFTSAVVDAGFRELDNGCSLSVVLPTAVTAAGATVNALTERGSGRT